MPAAFRATDLKALMKRKDGAGYRDTLIWFASDGRFGLPRFPLLGTFWAVRSSSSMAVI